MKKFGALLLVYFLGVSVVEAQDTFSRVTVFAAGSLVSGERSFAVNNDIFQTDFKKGGKIGARYTMDFTNQFAGEASYSFGRNSLKVTRLDPPPTERVFETNLHQFSVNGLYYFTAPGENLRPFLTGGLGISHFAPTDEATVRASNIFIDQATRIGSSTRLGLNFGGGIESVVNEWLGIRLDIRDHIIRIPRYGLPETPLNPGGVFFPVSGVVQNVEAAVGAVFYIR